MKRIVFLILMLLSGTVFAQTEGTTYFMNSLAGVSSANPAFVPKYKFSLGLPGISSTAVGYYNNGFSYNDLTTISGTDVQANLPKWVKALTRRNYINTTAESDLLRLGIRITPKLYMQTNVTAHAYARFQLPKEITSLFVNGTAPLIGTTASFSPQAEALGYVEAALGAAYQIDDKLTIGARLKYLQGVVNATTVSSMANLSVGNDYQISANADLNMKTSGFQNQGNDMKHFQSNHGMGIDLGATYKLTEKLTLAASIIDLGKISWNNNPYAYTLNKNTAQYTFSGIDLKQVVNGNSNYMQSQTDSLQQKFKLQEGKTGSYSTWIPSRMYVSGNYELRKNLSVGAVFFSERFQGRMSSGASASLIKHFGRWVSTSLSYTASNRSYNNIGAGLSFNLAPFQFYLAGDNLLRLPGSLIATGKVNSYLNSTQVFNLRFGLNFVWGWDRGKDKLSRNKENVNEVDNSKSKQRQTKDDPAYLKVRKSRK